MSNHHTAAPIAGSVAAVELRLPTRAHSGVTTDMAVAAAEAPASASGPLLRRSPTGPPATPSPCRSRAARPGRSVCPSCADKARRLRMHQCREGWHRTDDPPRHLDADQPTTTDDDEPRTTRTRGRRGEEEPARRVRSTRRRAGRPGPAHACRWRTAPSGATFTDAKTGQDVPAVDVPHPHPALLRQGHPRRRRPPATRPATTTAGPRWTRCIFPQAGRPVLAEPAPLRRLQGAVLRRRRSPTPPRPAPARRRPRRHPPATDQGRSSPRTYVRSGGPPSTEPVYDRRRAGPVWDRDVGRYVDPRHRRRAADLGAGPRPARRRPGRRAGARAARSATRSTSRASSAAPPDRDRAVRYLIQVPDQVHRRDLRQPTRRPTTRTRRPRAYERHIDRLHAEVRWLPCSPGCANWLRYGIQPKDAGPGLVPGRCPSKAHDRDNLGLGGRRVLVSRQWTGKTLDPAQGRPRRRRPRRSCRSRHRGPRRGPARRRRPRTTTASPASSGKTPGPTNATTPPSSPPPCAKRNAGAPSTTTRNACSTTWLSARHACGWPFGDDPVRANRSRNLVERRAVMKHQKEVPALAYRVDEAADALRLSRSVCTS